MTAKPLPSSQRATINSSSSPLLLLKNPSEPVDAYETYWGNEFHGPVVPEKYREGEAGNTDATATSQRRLNFSPHFLPVQQFVFKTENLVRVKQLLQNGAFRASPQTAFESSVKDSVKWGSESLPHSNDVKSLSSPHYGGLVFTSPRACSAFLSTFSDDPSAVSLPPNFPIYSVGPGTTSVLASHSSINSLTIFGDESGNGAKLAEFIKGHYGTPSNSSADGSEDLSIKSQALPLLFLAGEQRRDILPRTLRSAGFIVDELVVYEAVMTDGFAERLTLRLDELARPTSEAEARDTWVVIFSPTGCKELLQYCGILDESNSPLSESRNKRKRIKIATIGPTTRDFLIENFDFTPDACAPRPTPEGVEEAIKGFLDAAV
ncbi:MAG: hypothetical protein M4579_005865 [Chaenotheca gracillima]|nr:MAG: hypothetical protein M4579_005865 [Chaenotheca gracillima]